MARFHKFDNLLKAKEEDLITIEGVGPEIAKSLILFLKNKNNQSIIERLKNYGMFKAVYDGPSDNAIFTGMTFVLTGELQTFKRSELKEKLESLGAKVSNSVSKKTSFIVVGNNPGSKFDKAQKLGTKTLTEQEIKKMISDNV